MRRVVLERFDTWAVRALPITTTTTRPEGERGYLTSRKIKAHPVLARRGASYAVRVSVERAD